jgi:threonine/homoserine/homoserine lactone efflux protein
MSNVAAFLGVSALVIATPGQDTALTVRNTLLAGRAGGVFTAIGVSAGQATWTVAAGVGVGAFLVSSEPAFVALKLAGSAYLVVLGGQAVHRTLRSRNSKTPVVVEPRPAPLTPFAALRQGALSNLANPKMLAFFTSLLPQFASSLSGVLALGLLFCSMTLSWLTAYAFAVARAGALLHRSRVRRTIEAVTGTVLVALGLRLATEAR